MDLKHRLGFSSCFSVDDGGVEFIDDFRWRIIDTRDACLSSIGQLIEASIELDPPNPGIRCPTLQARPSRASNPPSFPKMQPERSIQETRRPFPKGTRDVILWKRLPRLHGSAPIESTFQRAMDPLLLNSTSTKTTKSRSPSTNIGSIGSEYPEISRTRRHSRLSWTSHVLVSECRGGDIDVNTAILKRICFGTWTNRRPPMATSKPGSGRPLYSPVVWERDGMEDGP